MAQKKKSKAQTPKKTRKKINRSQKIMVVVGVFIILAMLLPSLLYFFQ